MTTLKIQSILDFADNFLSPFSLTALAACQPPAGYDQVLLDLAGSAEETDPSVLNWRTTLEEAGFSFNYTPFDNLSPLAIHNRLFRAQSADHLIVLDLKILPAFHLLERLSGWANRLSKAGQKWGVVEARCTPLDRPRPIDPTSFESGALLPGAFLLNRAAWAEVGPFDEGLIDTEAATLDWGWRSRAAGYCLFRALDTFFYDPRPVDADGLVYTPAEVYSRKLGRAALYFKYGRPDQANTLLADLKAIQPNLANNWATWKPASPQEVQVADWTGLEKLDDWLEPSNPERNYGNRLEADEALPPPLLSEVTPGNRDDWARPVLELIARIQPAAARLLDLGGRLPAGFQMRLAEHGLPYEAIVPGDLAEAIESLVERAASGELPVTLLALPENPLEQTPAELLKLLAGQARLILVARNNTHQDLAIRLLSGQPVPPADLAQAYSQAQLLELIETAGWRVTERADLIREHSALYTPDLLLEQATLAGDTLRHLASVFNPSAQTEFFVWQLEPALSSAFSDEGPTAPTVEALPAEVVMIEERPAISVLVRTQGRRNELLTETLYSVLAQGGSYEIVIALQIPDEAEVTVGPAFRAFLSKLPTALQAKIRVIEVFGVGNALPVNSLLDACQGLSWFFLDDDDLLVGGYFKALEKAQATYGAERPILHTFALRRDVTIYEQGLAPNDPNGVIRTFPYATTRLDLFWNKPYQPVFQYFNNELPNCCYLIPSSLLSQTNLRFKSHYNLYNDWEFLMRATSLCKVVTLPIFGSCVNMRTNNSQTVGNSDLARQWAATYTQLAVERERHPLLLEGRAVREIVQTFQTIEELRTRLFNTGEELGQVRGAVDQSQADLARVTSELEYVRHQLEYVRSHLEGELEYVRSHLEGELEARRADLTLARAVILAHQAELNRLNEALDNQQKVTQLELHARESYRQQLEQSQAYVAQLEGQLGGTYRSLSWRLTFPLRLGLRLLGRLRRRG